jgi:hypothetical protein
MNSKRGLIIAGVLGALLLAGYLWWQGQAGPEVAPVVSTPEPAPPPSVAPVAEAAPTIAHPLELPEAEPLPEIDASDGLLASSFAALFGDKPWARYFYPEGIVRRIVATVDNLPRQESPVKVWPVRPLGGWLATAKADDGLVIGPDNAKRYAGYVRLAETLDTEKLVALYRRFYPLFQQAYQDLGFPDAYFNDRLIVALDDLLATPEPLEPLRLVQDKVHYRFADPDLDRRSAGQKIMLRMGTDNARKLKPKLRELRQALARPERP